VNYLPECAVRLTEASKSQLGPDFTEVLPFGFCVEIDVPKCIDYERAHRLFPPEMVGSLFWFAATA